MQAQALLALHTNKEGVLAFSSGNSGKYIKDDSMYSNKIRIYQTAQIRELESLAQERFNIPPENMMQRAGKAAFEFLLRRFPQAQKISLFCGSGNNAGDGYVVAQHAHERG